MAAIMDWSTAYAHVEDAAKEALSAFPLPYASASALAVSFQIVLLCIVGCWVATVVTANYSHVDRLWSIVPWVYVWHFAYRAYLDDGNVWNDRLLIMATISTMWGLRLSFNFWRKGGYSLKEEDYRWPVVRDFLHPVARQIFIPVFIAAYQHVLLFWLALPAYVAYTYRTVPLQELDTIAAFLFVSFLEVEAIADQQQWNFYQTKYALIAKKQTLTGDYKVGFNRSGLFRFSRHPNFFAEQCLWCVFYLFGVASSGVAFNPAVLGALQLIVLFQGSIALTEYITVGKYPAYTIYQAQVPMLIPRLFGGNEKRMD